MANNRTALVFTRSELADLYGALRHVENGAMAGEDGEFSPDVGKRAAVLARRIGRAIDASWKPPRPARKAKGRR